MRNILILFSTTLLLAFACKTTKTISKDNFAPIEILESKKENWVSGAREGYGGTDYFIQVKILTDKNIIFESIIVEGVIYELKILKNDEIIYDQKSIKTGDILMLRATQLHSNHDTPLWKANSNVNQNNAFINMKINRSTYKQAIEQFEIIKGPLRP